MKRLCYPGLFAVNSHDCDWIGLRALKRRGLFLVGNIFLNLLLSSLCVMAEPSGGPYGPVPMTYSLPKGPGKIYFVAPNGSAEASGESLARPTTLEAAVERGATGDAIILRGGTYRTGNLLLNQGITLQPYADEQPVLKGTYAATEWKALGNGLWKTSWTRLFPGKPDGWWSRDRFGKLTPLYRFNNDMVFVDGRLLHAVGWEGEVNENTYYIDYDAGQVYIGTDPQNRLVEITAFDVAIKRVTDECHGKTSDHKGPIIRGITFTQYAYRAIDIEGKEPEEVMEESQFGKDVVGTTLENCAFTFCSRVAAYLRGDKLTMRHCTVSDTRTEGIYIIASSDVLLEKNIFTRNNIEPFAGYYPAAVKVFNQSHRVTVRDNLIYDLPNSNGVWFDVGEVDGQFIDNWVEGVGNPGRKFNYGWPYPSSNGFFCEISKSPICAGNVFVNCDHGIFILNSSNARIYQNTFVNSTACIARNGRTPANDRLFGWHSSTGPDVDKRGGHVFVNNLLTGNNAYRRPLLFVNQPAELCKQLDNPQLKEIDHNVYVRHIDSENPLIAWSPARDSACQARLNSPADLHKLYPDFSAHSEYFAGNIPLFKSRELGDYRLLDEFPGTKDATAIPEEIRQLLGITGASLKYVGAYPPIR
jgi:parallel beta-helix repeat protein